MALPKFARNYTRPGAYESPNTPIDTQSGAIIAQAISNIGNITANFINNQNKAVSAENAAIKKSLNAINKKATEQKGELATKIGEHGSAQNSNYAEVGVGIIDYLEQQQTLLSQYKRNNDSENISKTEENIFKANIGYGNVLQLIQSTPDALTTYGEDAASANLGDSGGVALTGQGKQSSEYWLGMAAFGGSAEGAYSKLNYDFDEHKLSLNLDSMDISKNQKSFTGSDKFDPSFKGITVDPLAFINSDPGVVPDIKTNAIKLLGRKTEDNPNGLNLVGSNGQVNDLRYYDTNKPSEVKEVAGKVYVKYAYNEKVLADTLAAPVNSNLVVPFTTSSDVSRANMINTNIYSQPMMIPDSNIANKNGSPLSVEDQINFEKNTMAYTMSLIPQPKEFVFDKDEYYNITKKTAAQEKAAKTDKEIAETAPRVYTDIFKNPESYFKNKKIGDKDVLKVNVSPGSVPAGGGEVYPIIELGYKSGTSTKGGEQTIFTDDMSFDLSDPVRVRALIDMLPEGADMKKELKKLVGDNPIESVSIETFEQNPPIYKGISL